MAARERSGGSGRLQRQRRRSLHDKCPAGAAQTRFVCMSRRTASCAPPSAWCTTQRSESPAAALQAAACRAPVLRADVPPFCCSSASCLQSRLSDRLCCICLDLLLMDQLVQCDRHHTICGQLVGSHAKNALACKHVSEVQAVQRPIVRSAPAQGGSVCWAAGHLSLMAPIVLITSQSEQTGTSPGLHDWGHRQGT